PAIRRGRVLVGMAGTVAGHDVAVQPAPRAMVAGHDVKVQPVPWARVAGHDVKVQHVPRDTVESRPQ
ncbi:MAG: hypothetical protein J0H57_20675, partial [Rhodospirillales bacterium]|nr:hypothetical protein [Rhodospirillales bacterium]